MTVGFVAGAFDLLHVGHLHLLEKCKEQCDYLIVGLHIDPRVERPDKNRPIETLLERQIRLRSCKYVDEVIVYQTETDLINILRSIHIDTRFLGTDYKIEKKPITDEGVVPIKYIDSFNLHTSDLRDRIKKS